MECLDGEKTQKMCKKVGLKMLREREKIGHFICVQEGGKEEEEKE